MTASASTPGGEDASAPLFARPAGADPASVPPESAPRFEEALERLEGLVEELESGDLPLEDTIRKFEEGQRLLRACHELLERAELRVREILGRADGSVEERPWSGESNGDEDAADGA